MREGLAFSGSARAGELVVEADLTIAPGETVAVLGPNGAGKTTLLRALCGLLPLSAGSVRLGGRVLEDVARDIVVPPEDRSIGVVFQDLLLFPGLDVADNVAFGLRARGMRRREARRHAVAWLERLGLADRTASAVRNLSGGEAQRVALARALAPEPQVLLLDEPLAALDAEVRADVRRGLLEHRHHHAGPCVLVTHDPLDAAVLADRVVVLEHGRVTAAGTLADVVARPRTSWAAELAGTNLVPATATGARMAVAGGGEVLAAEGPGDGPVLVAIRPAAVALHRTQPEGSPRNAWPVTVVGVEGFGERVRVRLDGAVPLVAEVTATAVAELRIGPGEQVWASVKATEVAAYPA